MQKYQVFIKQNQLSFVEKAEKYEQSANTLFITSPESEEFEIMVKGLLELPQKLNLQFVGS